MISTLTHSNWKKLLKKDKAYSQARPYLLSEEQREFVKPLIEQKISNIQWVLEHKPIADKTRLIIFLKSLELLFRKLDTAHYFTKSEMDLISKIKERSKKSSKRKKNNKHQNSKKKARDYLKEMMSSKVLRAERVIAKQNPPKKTGRKSEKEMVASGATIKEKTLAKDTLSKIRKAQSLSDEKFEQRIAEAKDKKDKYNLALEFVKSFIKGQPTVSSVSSLISYREKKLRNMKYHWEDAWKSKKKSMKITNKAIPLANEIKDLKEAKKAIQKWKKLKWLHNRFIDYKIERLRRDWQTSTSYKERKHIEFRAKELKKKKVS